MHTLLTRMHPLLTLFVCCKGVPGVPEFRFGNFNQLFKLCPQMLHTWARLPSPLFPGPGFPRLPR